MSHRQEAHAWISTKDTLQLLPDLGVDPTSDRVRRAIGQVRERCTWGEEFGDSPFFEGEVEPCINGRVLAIGAYFGEASDRLVDRLLREQLSDGGWNCDARPPVGYWAWACWTPHKEDLRTCWRS